ncbi:MAG TPA: hypothetical protein VM536_03580 [Chloroflexia bacterium]|nr:hypothetical protein [Chloroflexia bacterium]
MPDQPISRTQRLLLRIIAPAERTKAAMEADSRSWMVQCPGCGFQQSIWELGGIRYKAGGTSYQFRRCPSCGKRAWHKVYRATEPSAAGPVRRADTGGLPAWLLWAAAVGLLAALIAVFFIGIWLLTSVLTQPVASAGDSFMTALSTGRYDSAYDLATPELQQELTSVAGLATLVQPYQPARWSWTSRSIRNGVGRVEGLLTYAGGKTGTVHLVLRQVGSVWRIGSFQMNPP